METKTKRKRDVIKQTPMADHRQKTRQRPAFVPRPAVPAAEICRCSISTLQGHWNNTGLDCTLHVLWQAKAQKGKLSSPCPRDKQKPTLMMPRWLILALLATLACRTSTTTAALTAAREQDVNQSWFQVASVVVVVLTTAHRHNTMTSVVAGVHTINCSPATPRSYLQSLGEGEPPSNKKRWNTPRCYPHPPPRWGHNDEATQTI